MDLGKYTLNLTAVYEVKGGSASVSYTCPSGGDGLYMYADGYYGAATSVSVSGKGKLLFYRADNHACAIFTLFAGDVFSGTLNNGTNAKCICKIGNCPADLDYEITLIDCKSFSINANGATAAVSTSNTKATVLYAGMRGYQWHNWSLNSWSHYGSPIATRQYHPDWGGCCLNLWRYTTDGNTIGEYAQSKTSAASTYSASGVNMIMEISAKDTLGYLGTTKISSGYLNGMNINAVKKG